MQPQQRVPLSGQPWYKRTPVGVSPLKNMMTKISELGGLPVKYTNHSLRATSASRMFVSGVPEKIVSEVTGHKSVKALRQYERTTEEQYQAVGHSIAHMQAFESSTSVQSVTKTEKQAQGEMEDNKEKAAAMVGELQKSLPSISRNLSNCTFHSLFTVCKCSFVCLVSIFIVIHYTKSCLYCISCVPVSHALLLLLYIQYWPYCTLDYALDIKKGRRL